MMNQVKVLLVIYRSNSMKVSELMETLSNYDKDDSITFYYLKNDTLTNCQLESTCWYPDMGIEFTIQETTEFQEDQE